MGTWGRRTKSGKPRRQNRPNWRKVRGTGRVRTTKRDRKDGRPKFNIKNVKTEDWEKV